jgi:hypothetical protein
MIIREFIKSVVLRLLVLAAHLGYLFFVAHWNYNRELKFTIRVAYTYF